jgi:hypothetical protein
MARPLGIKNDEATGVAAARSSTNTSVFREKLKIYKLLEPTSKIYWQLSRTVAPVCYRGHPYRNIISEE